MSYTPPDIGNISFILGDGSLTSPYTDIFAPLSILESDVVTDIYCWGDSVQPMSEIFSDLVNPSILYGDFVGPSTPAIHAEVFNYQLLVFDIRQPISQVSCEAVTENIVNGYFRQPRGAVNCWMGIESSLSAPTSEITSVSLTPNIVFGDLIQPKAVQHADITPWAIIVGSVSVPGSEISALCEMPALISAALVQKKVIVSGIAEATTMCSSVILQKLAIVKSDMYITNDYEVIRHEEP